MKNGTNGTKVLFNDGHHSSTDQINLSLPVFDHEDVADALVRLGVYSIVGSPQG